jgi:hypothetical protein
VIDRAELLDLIEAELSAIADGAERRRVRQAVLDDPVLMRCGWDYGEEDETFPCWKVAANAERGVGVVHCEQGFGPETPWGLIWLKAAVPRMGPDFGWFATLREALEDLLS